MTLIEDLPAAPLLLVANEFFDALPIRQFVDGIERRVEVIGDGLAFDRDGEIVEQSPAREAGCFGHRHLPRAVRRSRAASSTMAMREARPATLSRRCAGHRYVPTLIDAGEQDLTSHVDFEALGRAASEAGAKVTPVVTQGDWLNRLGIGARAASLATANPERIPELEKAVDRLCHEEQMGQLFKVMAIHSPDWPAPAGFEA